MKSITFNITHEEVFNNLMETLEGEDTQYHEIIKDGNNVTVNITGTLEELDNE